MAALLRRRLLLADTSHFTHLFSAGARTPPSTVLAASIRTHAAPSAATPHVFPPPRSCASSIPIQPHRLTSPRPTRSTLSARTPPASSMEPNFGAPSASVLPRRLSFGAPSTSVLPRRLGSLAAVGQKRPFSSEVNVNSSRPAPVRQLVFMDDSLALDMDWVDITEYLKDHSLVTDARENHLTLEIPGFGEEPRYNLSDHTGRSLFQCLVLLALANSNRGYCIKRSFKKDNLLVCPRLNQIMFKEVIYDDLETEVSSACNRASSCDAAGSLMRELLIDNVGPDVISRLLEEPADLLCKLDSPSDERLIVYHPSFLSTDARVWFYEKLYRLFFKIFPTKNEKFRSRTDEALRCMAYATGNLLIGDIIKSHPLLAFIESAGPTVLDEKEERPEGIPSESSRSKTEKKLGKKTVALHRHAIEHAFDENVKQVQSNQVSRKKLWPYSLHQVVDFLKSVMPLHLLKSQETFLRLNMWHHLNVDNFWPRDLSWIGGVPEPTDEEKDAIKRVSYGKRRQDLRREQRKERQTS